MKFEIGKQYRHTSGRTLSVVAEADTVMFGKTLLAENGGNVYFTAVGRDEDAASNWVEISWDEWMKSFDTSPAHREPVHNVEFSGATQLYRGASAGTKGYASEGKK